MSEPLEYVPPADPVVVHGLCGQRVRDCVCPEGPGESIEVRIARLEADVADLHRRVPEAGIDPGPPPR
jgi:hypothetical protein